MNISKVNICGIPHSVEEIAHKFTVGDISLGEILYTKCEIKLNSDMPESLKKKKRYVTK